jgi:tripartite-type tricarboxylate transporter receptor subunit TctC
MKLLIGMLAALLATVALADDDYPARPVRLIIPSSASGGTDFVARAIAQGLSERWKRPVVPENQGGAGGLIGLQMLARAAPDGYVLSAFNVGQIVAAQLASTLSFERNGDFTPLARTATSPQMLVTWRELPVTPASAGWWRLLAASPATSTTAPPAPVAPRTSPWRPSSAWRS